MSTRESSHKRHKGSLHEKSDLSVQSLCPLCLCGCFFARFLNHRGTENTEAAQRRTPIRTFRAKPRQPLKAEIHGTRLKVKQRRIHDSINKEYCSRSRRLRRRFRLGKCLQPAKEGSLQCRDRPESDHLALWRCSSDEARY